MVEKKDIIPIISSRDVFLNLEDNTVTFEERVVCLSPTETDCFAILLLNDGAVERIDFVKRIWGNDIPEEYLNKNIKSLSAFIFGLRSKLAEIGIKDRLTTVRGWGYRWDVPEDHSP